MVNNPYYYSVTIILKKRLKNTVGEGKKAKRRTHVFSEKTISYVRKEVTATAKIVDGASFSFI
jgi:ribosomal protein S25